MNFGCAILVVQFCLCSEEHLRNSVAAATLVRPDRNLLCRRNHHSLLRFALLWIRPQHVCSAEHSATAPLFLRLLQPTGNKGSRLHRLFRQLSHDALQGQLEDALNSLCHLEKGRCLLISKADWPSETRQSVTLNAMGTCNCGVNLRLRFELATSV